MSQIAIIGPGAIGGTIATWLSHSGHHNVILCSRSSMESVSVEHPDGELRFQGSILTADAELGPVDWILVATKAYDSDPAATWFSRLAGPGTRLAILQNGVDHVDRFKHHFDIERIVPVIVDIPAERKSREHILQRRHGSLTVENHANGNAFAALFAACRFELRVVDDFTTAAWNKLCINAAGVVSALTMRPAEVMHEPTIAELAKGIVMECANVGRAMGATLPGDIADRVIRGYQQAAPESINSLHGDRIAHKPGEIQARNGIIVELGRTLNIPTPLNAMAVALLQQRRD